MPVGLRALSLKLAAGLLACAIPAVAEEGDPEAGKEIFQYCSGCHQVGKGAEHGIGPHLNGLFGRKAATQEGFPYSESFKRAGTGGLEWHADTLDVFLENPTAIASGTRMSFDGLEDPQERLDLIAYLRRFSDNPRDIPEADPTIRGMDHDVAPEILALVGDPEYGEYLSGECVACHQAGGANDGIPSIVLWPEEDFVVAMHAYKNKQRNHPVMQMVAGRLGDEEIAALAAYFGQLTEQ
ncbi:Cytochrome c2 precursor [Roseovarius sp. THAF8]|uniref:c-type cytochrome n=1 Tax=Roseovarius sp. THAF8 TaxID=2587846 RepID=UPI001268F179|nr:c-type cytochrome [Roseovarius sp. THAF8]QFT97114.1 Cytochrome c2 precursor [Roseovarius sp. THAF8]